MKWIIIDIDLGYIYQMFFTLTTFNVYFIWFQYINILIFEIFKVCFDPNFYYGKVSLAFEKNLKDEYNSAGWMYFNIILTMFSVNAIYIIML